MKLASERQPSSPLTFSSTESRSERLCISHRLSKASVVALQRLDQVVVQGSAPLAAGRCFRLIGRGHERLDDRLVTDLEQPIELRDAPGPDRMIPLHGLGRLDQLARLSQQPQPRQASQQVPQHDLQHAGLKDLLRVSLLGKRNVEQRLLSQLG